MLWYSSAWCWNTWCSNNLVWQYFGVAILDVAVHLEGILDLAILDVAIHWERIHWEWILRCFDVAILWCSNTWCSNTLGRNRPAAAHLYLNSALPNPTSPRYLNCQFLLPTFIFLSHKMWKFIMISDEKIVANLKSVFGLQLTLFMNWQKMKTKKQKYCKN